MLICCPIIRASEFQHHTSFLCLVAMEATGYFVCYWCQKNIDNRANIPLVVFHLGFPLCDECFDELVDDPGGQTPRRPSAICHRSNALRMVMRRVNLHVDWRHVASFLENWHRPGAGSRRTPVTRPVRVVACGSGSRYPGLPSRSVG